MICSECVTQCEGYLHFGEGYRKRRGNNGGERSRNGLMFHRKALNRICNLLNFLYLLLFHHFLTIKLANAYG